MPRNRGAQQLPCPLLPSSEASIVANDAPPTATPLRPLPRQVTFDSVTYRSLLHRLMPSTWKPCTVRSAIRTYSTWKRVMPVGTWRS